jgi:hypothetical protein
MKDRMHEQMSAELKQNTRTDTIVVITSIILNLLFLGINSGVASSVHEYEYNMSNIRIENLNVTALVILVILFAMVIAINFFSLRIIAKGKERRARLMAGLMKMYQEEKTEQYYDSSIEQGYDARYNLFSAIILCLGAVAILVPILVSSMSC